MPLEGLRYLGAFFIFIFSSGSLEGLGVECFITIAIIIVIILVGR